MHLYNTLTRRVEPFNADTNVTVYVCGITPYDTTHLGHAFLYVFFDVLIRHLESRGHKVTFAQNITDLDDDILRKAGEVNMDFLELANREAERFERDMKALNVRRPDHYPRATQEVGDIIQIVTSLLDNGNAYTREGNVYFDISTFASYGDLSRADRDTMLKLAAENGGHPEDPLRDDPLDFVLWQAAKPGEPKWSSPWGEGRPGWHIECSEMALKYLGKQVTIHGGGGDLVFPHHESERAQSETYTGEAPFVKYWVHVAMLRYQGEKMSKSLGNLVLAGDLLQTYSADAIRLALLTHHYRTEWEYRDEDIENTRNLSLKLSQAARLPSGNGTPTPYSDFKAAFVHAMNNDLDTPRAVAALVGLADVIEAGSGVGEDVTGAQAALRGHAGTLGLALRD